MKFSPKIQKSVDNQKHLSYHNLYDTGSLFNTSSFQTLKLQVLKKKKKAAKKAKKAAQEVEEVEGEANGKEESPKVRFLFQSTRTMQWFEE